MVSACPLRVKNKHNMHVIYTQMYRNNYDTMLKTLWLLIMMPKIGLKISIQDKDYALISSRTYNVYRAILTPS